MHNKKNCIFTLGVDDGDYVFRKMEKFLGFETRKVIYHGERDLMIDELNKYKPEERHEDEFADFWATSMERLKYNETEDINEATIVPDGDVGKDGNGPVFQCTKSMEDRGHQ